jgi:hypothetical protein
METRIRTTSDKVSLMLGKSQDSEFEAYAAKVCGIMWNTIDASVIEPLLAEDVRYESQNVMDAIRGMKAVNKQIKGEEKKINLPKTVCGVSVLSGDELLGMDIFDSSKTFSLYKQKLLQSYLIEGLKRKGEKTKKEYVEGLLHEMLDSKVALETNPLSQSVVGLRTERLKVDLLLYEDRVCHLTAFER